MATLKRLIIEIHRRSVWQVLLVYCGAAWVCFQVIDSGSPYLYELQVDPRYDSLRSDPRFAELLDRLDWEVSATAPPGTRRSRPAR